jgi:Metallo-peptidase family M12/GEVED domain/Secretion system C-terminal sorting domain/Fibronectin type III domain
MKTIARFFCLAVLCFFCTTSAQAQTDRPISPLQIPVAENKLPKFEYYNANNLFVTASATANYDQMVAKADYMTLKADKLADLMSARPRNLILTIPTADGDLHFELTRANLFAENFEARDAASGLAVDWKPGLYYRGHLVDHDQKLEGSIAAISFFDNEVFGVVSYGGTNYVIGYLGDRTAGPTNDYVYYADNQLLVANTTECHTNTDDIVVEVPTTSLDKSLTRRQFNEYLVGDYSLYQDFGNSYNATTNHMTALYNVVAFLYEREDVGTLIEYTYVWSSTDPYNDTDTGTQLDDFDDWLNPFNPGEISLAHLISGAGAGGGLAWVDVLCDGDDLAGRSGVSNIYTSFNQFPTYSWSVMVVTHEIGHNLGSSHTHSCVWNGNNTRIDNCGGNAGYTSGTCNSNPTNPANGGTIMSYCHLQSVGINLWYGFGSQPGDLIRSKLAGATCLQTQYANCDSYTNIGCGQTISSTTIGLTNHATTYYNYTDGASSVSGSPISWNESGPDRAFMVQLDEPSTLTATLSGMSADLDVFILSSCNEYTVLGYGNSVATATALPAGTYWIIVEGYNGVSGTFDLTVDCDGCASYGQTTLEWMASAQIGNINNVSGNNDGYGNYDYLTLNTGIQDSVSISLMPGYASSTYNENFRIYIDYNKDGDYYDNNEMVFEGSGNNTAVTGAFQIPINDADGNSSAGNTTMRVVMKYGSAGQPCGMNSFGETEDYSVNIAGTCPTNPNSAYEWIESFQVGTQAFSTGNNDGFYVHPTAVNVIAGLATDYTFTPGYSSSNWSEYWKWYADWNSNGFFESEILTTPKLAGAQTGQMTISPSYPWGGSYRTRLVMSYSMSYDPCKEGHLGETEEIMMNLCSRYEGATGFEFIDSVRFATIGHQSGNNSGYTNSYKTFSSVKGGTVAFFGKPGYTGSTYAENWGVWVDWNLDGAFVATEKVITKAGSGNVTSSFVVPFTTAVGNYPVRVIMNYGSAYTNGCAYSYYSGEMEEYTLEVTSATCANSITTPSVVRLSPTSVSLIWNRVPGAQLYRLSYRQAGTATWSALLSSTTNSMVLTGLLENSTYEYRIQVKCPSGYTGYTPAPYFTFATVTSTGACAKPTVLNTSPINSTSQTLFWNYTPNAIKYRLRYRETALFPIVYTIKTVTAPTTSLIVTGLKPGTGYTWQVQALCPPGLDINYTSYSAFSTFTTLGNGTALMAFDTDNEVLQGDIALMAKLVPNPATEEVTILLDENLEISGLTIVNLNGQKIMSVDQIPADNKIQIESLTSGVYSVIITTTDGQTIVERLIKI